MRGILVAVLVAVSVVAAEAQNVPEQSVPTIEPRFTRVFGADSMEIASPTMSPDGRWIAFIAYSSRRVRGSSLWLVDLSEALEVGGI
ncbi:MAG: hypothetical protein PVJ64_00010 [Gemmatimonadales bacterium]